MLFEGMLTRRYHQGVEERIPERAINEHHYLMGSQKRRASKEDCEREVTI